MEYGEGVEVARRAECGVKGGETAGMQRNKSRKERQERAGSGEMEYLCLAVDAQSAAALKRLVTWWRSCGSLPWGAEPGQGKRDSSVCRVCTGKLQIHVRASRLCVLLGACQTELPSNTIYCDRLFHCPFSTTSVAPLIYLDIDQ